MVIFNILLLLWNSSSVHWHETVLASVKNNEAQKGHISFSSVHLSAVVMHAALRDQNKSVMGYSLSSMTFFAKIQHVECFHFTFNSF